MNARALNKAGPKIHLPCILEASCHEGEGDPHSPQRNRERIVVCVVSLITARGYHKASIDSINMNARVLQ